MPLYIARNTTYVAGVTEVDAADLNELQDTTKELYTGHADRIANVSALEGPAITGSHVESPPHWLASGVQAHSVPLPLLEGDRLKSIQVTAYRTGAAALDLSVYYSNAGTYSGIGAFSQTWSPTISSIATLAMDDTDYIVGGAERLFFRFISGQANDRLYRMSVTYDRPMT